MASIVIVTNQCYLLAEAINYIVINESDDDNEKAEWNEPRRRRIRRRKKLSAREYIMEGKPFWVVVNFIPKGAPQQIGHGHQAMSKNSNDSGESIRITVQGLRRTLKVFQDIVAQLREQIPDEKFLDTLVDRFLTDIDTSDNKVIKKVGIK
jgi:hypothetical protein